VDEKGFESLRHHITQLLLPHGLTADVRRVAGKGTGGAVIEVFVADQTHSPPREVSARKPEALCDQERYLAFDEFILNEAIPTLSRNL
jgi:hypothetical protein